MSEFKSRAKYNPHLRKLKVVISSFFVNVLVMMYLDGIIVLEEVMQRISAVLRVKSLNRNNFTVLHYHSTRAVIHRSYMRRNDFDYVC